MLTISAKGVYGLTAMLDLAVNLDNGPTQIKDISKQYSIPQHYLEQILVILKRAGLVKSYRGAQGGYALSKRPDEITVMDVLSNLEGSMEIANQGRSESGIEFFWSELEKIIHQRFSATLQDLIEKKQEISKQLMYYI